jgi:hypothetical protein
VVNREKTGEIVFPRRVHTFPLVPPPHRGRTAGVLDRLDLFLEQQMDQFTVAGPRYVQTYRLPAAELEGKHGEMHHRADTYDTAVACIYFQERGVMDRAADLADALVLAINHDAKGGGRIMAATRADELLDRGRGNTTSEFVHDGGRRDVGNMSWAGLALTRMYLRTRRYRYLQAAETIGRWIVQNCAVGDDWGGFSGGEDQWGNKYLWRSVEHNVDAFSLFGKEAMRPEALEVDGCTTFGLMPEVTSDRHGWLGQNWDWLEGVHGRTFVLQVHRTDQPSFVCLTEAGIAGGKMGVNECGIGLVENGLASSQDGRHPYRKPFHVRCREVLDAWVRQQGVG